MRTTGFVLFLGAALAAPSLAQQPPPRPSPTAEASPAPGPAPITIRSAETGDLTVFFLNAPWGPQTFAMMERGGDSIYNKRTWPFARLEARRPFTLEDCTPIPPGNYALVFHPNPPTNEGMSLEVKRIDVPEFLQEGNVMVRCLFFTGMGSERRQVDLSASAFPDARRVGVGSAKQSCGFAVDIGDCHWGR